MFPFPKSFLVAALATLVVAQDTATDAVGAVRACSCSHGFINVPVKAKIAANPSLGQFLNATTLRTIDTEWSVFAEFCQPIGGIESTGVQLMLHGQTYTSQYWNPRFNGFTNYSYVDYACSRGLSSLAYDNVGSSSP